MFIGHLPAGYILTKLIQQKSHTTKYFFVGLIASILPDIDILYFYLADNRQTLHHDYWTHKPFSWLIIALLTFGVIWLIKKMEYVVGWMIFFGNIFLHLILDTIVGKIAWLYPLTERAFFFFNVPATHDFWVYNFFFHWTFLFEIAIVIWAISLFMKKHPS